MEVIYLHHSGFMVLLDGLTLVFDPTTQIQKPLLDKNPKVIFIVSHAHGDHYNRSIWNYDRPGVSYVISDDIRQDHTGSNIHYVHPYQTLEVDGARIETFGSTDAGISALVEAQGKTVFFSGDLNWWAWDPKTRPHINPAVEERDYKNEIAKLKASLGAEKLDVAFVPVDPRLDLKGGELMAAKYFIKEIAPEFLVPMHFWGDFSVIDRLKASLPKDCPTKVVSITHRDQVLDL